MIDKRLSTAFAVGLMLVGFMWFVYLDTPIPIQQLEKQLIRQEQEASTRVLGSIDDGWQSPWPPQTTFLDEPADLARMSSAPHGSPLAGRRCEMKDCPGTLDSPYLYYMTSHRNRAHSYARLLRSLKYDLDTDKPLPLTCVCIVVADFNDDVVGPTVDTVIDREWGDGWVKYIGIKGMWSKTWGFRAAIDQGVITPHNQSIVMFMDTDMVVMPGFAQNIIRYSRPGVHFYAPVVADQTHATSYGNRNMGYKWRKAGYGMLGAYASDWDTLELGWPGMHQITWGGEDLALFNQLVKVGVAPVRMCEPRLWHMNHPKSKWEASSNGQDKAGVEVDHSKPQEFQKMPHWWPDQIETAVKTREYEMDDCVPKAAEEYSKKEGWPMPPSYPGQKIVSRGETVKGNKKKLR